MLCPLGWIVIGNVEAIWGLSWKAFEATWVKPGAIWDYGGAILGLIGRSWGLFGSTLGANAEGLDFGIWRLRVDRNKTIEKACIAEMSKSLSPYACTAKSLFSAKTSARLPIPGGRKCL